MALAVSETLSLARAARRRQVWSVGGGKGGIGKSLIAASLGWQLARMGQQVVVVDADLGGANLHTCLGLPNPARTLADFIQRRVDLWCSDVPTRKGIADWCRRHCRYRYKRTDSGRDANPAHVIGTSLGQCDGIARRQGTCYRRKSGSQPAY